MDRVLEESSECVTASSEEEYESSSEENDDDEKEEDDDNNKNKIKVVKEDVKNNNGEPVTVSMFDHEMTNYQDEIAEETTKLENAHKDRDKLANEKNNLQKEVLEKDDEISQLRRKIVNLESEAVDAVPPGTEKELFHLKRQNRELESKVQDLEEELDEQAGTIQQLQQHKTRMEMQLNREKQSFEKELETKDEEFESAKTDYSRKMKALEEQLGEETKRKDDIMKSKRELEQKVLDLESSVDDNMQDKGVERKLRKELKRVKLLYNDAKAAVEVPPPKSSDSSELKGLRSQIEDADNAKHVALKAKAQVESELEELKAQLDNATKSKENADSKCLGYARDNEDLQIRTEELEDEMEEFIRSNKMLSAQLMEAKTNVINEKEANRKLEEENIGLVEKVSVLSKKLDASVENKVEKTEVERLEVKLMDLECKIENDTAIRIKQEHFLNRLRGQLDRAVEENNNLMENQSSQQNNTSKYDRQLKDCRSELENVKASEAVHKRKREEAESEVRNLEDELSDKTAAISNLTKRIRELQAALERVEGSSDDDDLLDDASESDESFTSFNRSSMRRRQNPLLSSREPLTSRRTATTTDLSAYSGIGSRSSFRSSRRASATIDDYTSTNGFLSRDNSHDLDSHVTSLSSYTSRSTSRSTSRITSRMMSRQDSFE